MPEPNTNLGMACENCGAIKMKCIDTRGHGIYVRRRRECRICGTRTTTYELNANDILFVRKLLQLLPELNEFVEKNKHIIDLIGGTQ